MTTYKADVSNTADVIDSRDVIDRIAELEAESAIEGDDGEPIGLDENEWEELKALRAFAEEGEDFADWQYGEIFVRDSYFEDHARELAEDIGAIKGNEGWPLSYIDWSAAAEALQMDYTSIDFDGVTYWGRS